MKFLSIVAVAALASPMISSSAEDLQVKGRFIGQSYQTACGENSQRGRSLDEIIKSNIAKVPTLKLFNDSSCDIDVQTFAGQPLDGPMTLLFVDDKLIQAKFNLMPIEWTQSVKFLQAIKKSYGKDFRLEKDKVTGFLNQTWGHGNKILLLSRPDPKRAGDYTFEVVLKDKKAVDDFFSKVDYNKKNLEDSETNDASRDTK